MEVMFTLMKKPMTDSLSSNKRWFYIKNGDVCKQIEQLQTIANSIPTGGPLAFIGDFLRYTGNQPVFLLSTAMYTKYKKTGRTTALVLKTELKHNRSAIAKMGLIGLQLFNTLLRLIRYRPDRLICGKSGAMLWFSFIASKLLDIPWVHARHGRVTASNRSMNAKIKEAINRYCIRHATAVICHGPYLKKQLIDIGVCEKKIFEFDVGHTDFVNQANKLLLKNRIPLKISGEIFTLYAGRIEKNKGVFDILSAMEDRLKAQKGIGLVYAGEGRDLKRLRQEVQKRKLTKRVLIAGLLARDQLSSVMKEARFLVVATNTKIGEGRCMSAMESLSIGTPVIAPNFGPFPYLIEHKVNGLLYKSNSLSDLKIKIDLLFDNDSLYKQILKGVWKKRSELIRPTALSFSQAIDKAFKTVRDQ